MNMDLLQLFLLYILLVFSNDMITLWDKVIDNIVIMEQFHVRIQINTEDGDTHNRIEGMEALHVGTFIIVCADLYIITLDSERNVIKLDEIGCISVFGRVTDIKLAVSEIPVICVQSYRRTIHGYEPIDAYYTPDPISYTTIEEIGDNLTCLDISDYLPGDIGRYYGYYDIVVYNSRTHTYSFKEFVYKTWNEELKVRVVELPINGVRVRLLQPYENITLYIPKENEVIYIIPGISGKLVIEDN